MFLYNISYNLDNACISVLSPKIPYTAGVGEDNEIKRVCLCDCVENCLQAMASYYRKLESGTRVVIRKVYVDENDKNLIKPQELFELGLVPDALENHEFWYLNPIECQTAIATIENVETEFDIAWSCVPLKECQAIISKYTKDIHVEKFGSSFALYNAFHQWASKHEKYAELDDVWDEIVEIPWSQIVRINEVSLVF